MTSNEIVKNLVGTDETKINSALQELATLNVQVYPSKVRVELNNKDTKVIFGLTEKQYTPLIENPKEKRGILEKRNHKKHGNIKTSYTIRNAGNYANREPLNQFDRSVFSVMLSEQLAGNNYTTPAVINRGLTGKTTEGGNGKINTNQYEAILHSVEKLMSTLVYIDLTEKYEKLGYNGGKAKKLVGPVFPCKYVEATVNGKDASVIFFTGKPILYEIACDDNQILRYDPTLLNVPNQNNTPRIIAVKNYVMRRISEIKQHKMTPTITFENVFKKCNLNDVSRQSKLDARNAIIELFEQLQAKGEIETFTVNKNGNKFYGVSFTYIPKKQKPKETPPADKNSKPESESKIEKTDIPQSVVSTDTNHNKQISKTNFSQNLENGVTAGIGDWLTLHR